MLEKTSLCVPAGPQWLNDLCWRADRWVLAVAGTHGKTTTAAGMATSILKRSGYKPLLCDRRRTGQILEVSKRAVAREPSVLCYRSDEYDCAFFG